jgi:hypothetical protein
MSAARIYVGPTISATEIQRWCPAAQVAPPIAVGELYALALQPRRPKRVLIIDGYFERMAAVWHKEILFALERGIIVYGAASMGALRAAELAPMGMIGIGAIYRDFAAGRLVNDDEVAVAHLPASHGYAVMSEAMVNIRATLAAAVTQQQLSQRAAKRLLQHAQQLHYRDRAWETLFPDAPRKFARWVAQNMINLKARDARLALRALASPSLPRERAAAKLVAPMPKTWAMSVLHSLVDSWPSGRRSR